MRKAVLHVLIIALAMFGLALANSTAADAANPRISFGISHPVLNAGQRPVIYYSVTNAKKGSKLYLQRKMGSRGVWGSIARLPKRSGRVVAPRVPIGAYLYRVAVYSKSKHHKTTLNISAVHGVRAFGNISLKLLCYRSDQSGTCSGYEGSQAVGSRVYSWSFPLSSGGSGGYVDTTFARSTCRSIDMTFAPQGQGDGEYMSLTLIQQTRDAVQVTAPPHTVARVISGLDGRAFVMRFADSSSFGDNPLVAGTASCYTRAGQ